MRRTGRGSPRPPAGEAGAAEEESEDGTWERGGQKGPGEGEDDKSSQQHRSSAVVHAFTSELVELRREESRSCRLPPCTVAVWGCIRRGRIQGR